MNAEAPAKRWRLVDVLIVDEISMVSAEFWSACERCVRELRCSAQPWGGIQLVLSGDFCQARVGGRPLPGGCCGGGC